MRLFTAIEIPGDVTGQLREVLERLRPEAKISWTTPEKMHITTKFIGEWPEDRLEEMKRALQGVKIPEPIDIVVRGLGWFPNQARPRVLWAGVDGGNALRSLAKATHAALAAVPEEREYSPHLTLARIKDRAPLGKLTTAVEKLASTGFGSFHAAAFYLYLSRAGAYTKLERFELA